MMRKTTGWSLEIKEMSWVENTPGEVDFLVEALQLTGNERILDLACGFGRHCLELARRGYPVVGVDYTHDFIEDARGEATKQGLRAQFVEKDVREVRYHEEFDVVINMADGAIGYFETEGENLKLFDVIARALRPGGKHAMGVCNAAHFRKRCPSRAWQAGKSSLSLADFEWVEETRRYIYRNHVLKFGEVLQPLPDKFPADGNIGMRLYTLDEVKEILRARGLQVLHAYGDYNTAVPSGDEKHMLVVCSQKRV